MSGVHRRFILTLLICFLLVVGSTITQAQSLTSYTPECFNVPGIINCINGSIKDYWHQNGALPVFGYPITSQQPERNADTGQVYETQWFERNRFEQHPENTYPYHILLGRLGAELLSRQGRGFEPMPTNTAPTGRCRSFDVGGQTQYVCDPFLRYWESHGLDFDGQRGVNYAESLALFGLPLTYPKMETNQTGDTVLTQWFERARFEFHPNNPAEYRVLLGLLGNEMRSSGGSTPPSPSPSPSPSPTPQRGGVYDEARTVYLGNLTRRQHGLAPLRWNWNLTQAARWFAQDSVENRPTPYCGHQDTQGHWPDRRARDYGYTGFAGAENAFCGYVTPEQAIAGWMDSPGHRQNLLDPNSREVGLGYYLRASDGRGYVVQMFGHEAAYPPLVIENEAINTASPQVNLYIYDHEPGSVLGPISEMMISNTSDFANAAWEAYRAEKTWVLESGTGWRNVYVKLRDANNSTVVVSDTIYLGSNIPLDELGSAQMRTH